MVAHLNITMDKDLYLRLKNELPPKGISAFIEAAVRAKLRPSQSELERAYQAASEEPWRCTLAADWIETETDAWPE